MYVLYCVDTGTVKCTHVTSCGSESVRFIILRHSPQAVYTMYALHVYAHALPVMTTA